MPENSLQTILTNAKQINFHKYQLVQQFSNGNKASELDTIKKELDEIFAPTEQPSFYLNPPELDPIAIAQHIVVINLLNPKELEEYLLKITAFVEFMKTKVLINVEEEAAILPSDWNARTMNALMIMNRKVAGRKRVFLAQDPNLPNDPDYATVTDLHKELCTSYLDLLETNQIQSDASDVSVLNMFTTILPTIEILLDFINQMKQINQFVNGKIPVV